MLPVGVDQERVQPRPGRRLRRLGQPRLVGRLGNVGLGVGQAEVGQADLGELGCGGHGRHAPGWAGPAASPSTSPSALFVLPTNSTGRRASVPTQGSTPCRQSRKSAGCSRRMYAVRARFAITYSTITASVAMVPRNPKMS